jgi:hypothetical protein
VKKPCCSLKIFSQLFSTQRMTARHSAWPAAPPNYTRTSKQSNHSLAILSQLCCLQLALQAHDSLPSSWLGLAAAQSELLAAAAGQVETEAQIFCLSHLWMGQQHQYSTGQLV